MSDRPAPGLRGLNARRRRSLEEFWPRRQVVRWPWVGAVDPAERAAVLDALVDVGRRLEDNNHATSTKTAYGRDSAHFTEWCTTVSLPRLRRRPRTVICTLGAGGGRQRGRLRRVPPGPSPGRHRLGPRDLKTATTTPVATPASPNSPAMGDKMRSAFGAAGSSTARCYRRHGVSLPLPRGLG